MARGLKKAVSDRSMRSSPETEKDKKEIVYRQTALHAIDAAPEPNQISSINRHAVSAADLLNQSMSTMSNENSARSQYQSTPRSQSFTLKGSASSLLVKGGTVPPVRRIAELSTSSSTSPRSEREKRSIYAPKDLEGLQIDGSDNGAHKNQIDERDHESNSESTDSYDATSNVLGTGTDVSDSSGGKRKMSKQTSSLSGRGGQLGSIADMSEDSDELFDDDDEYHGSVSTYDEEDGQVTCCGLRTFQFRCIHINRIASAVVRYAPCFWCFPIPISATDRTVLTRLNIMSAFLTISQVIATSWLVIVMLIPATNHEQQDDSNITHGMAPNLWSLTGSMYSVGFFGETSEILII